MLLANSTDRAGTTQKRSFINGHPSLLEWEYKNRTPLVELGPVHLKGAVLGAPRIFWERAITPYYFRYIRASDIAAVKPPSRPWLILVESRTPWSSSSSSTTQAPSPIARVYDKCRSFLKEVRHGNAKVRLCSYLFAYRWKLKLKLMQTLNDAVLQNTRKRIKVYVPELELSVKKETC